MWADVLMKPLQGKLFRDMRAFLQNCSRYYDDHLERQEDERACDLMKQQVTTVTSSWECVDEHRSQAPSDVQNITIEDSRQETKSGTKEQQSNMCSPSEVKGKEARRHTRELIQSKNMDRQDISALTLRRDGIDANVQVAIINLISKIPMSI